MRSVPTFQLIRRAFRQAALVACLASPAVAVADGEMDDSPASSCIAVDNAYVVGPMSYRIEALARPERVAFERRSAEPSAGSTFIEVRYTAMNTGRKAKNRNRAALRIVDARDRAYLPDPIATVLHENALRRAHFHPKVAAGELEERVAIFEIRRQLLRDGPIRLTFDPSEAQDDELQVPLLCLPPERTTR